MITPETVQITFLSGGTGTPKLLDGMLRLGEMTPESMTVIVNTAEDITISGNRLCPDLDTVLYALAGCVDETDWFGIAGDSYETHDRIRDLSHSDGVNGRQLEPATFSGRSEFMRIGDKDRATHILRSALLAEGLNLTRVTDRLARSMGVESRILPMTHDPVVTQIKTPSGPMHFQEFWVARQGSDAVNRVEHLGIENASPTEQVLEALQHPVVIGPSNPITSIRPIIRLRGIREQLRKTEVIMISPFVEDQVFSGPADRFMKAEQHEPSTHGVIEFYEPLLDHVILDRDDATQTDLPVLRTDTNLDSASDRLRVAEVTLEAVRAVV